MCLSREHPLTVRNGGCTEGFREQKERGLSWSLGQIMTFGKASAERRQYQMT